MSPITAGTSVHRILTGVTLLAAPLVGLLGALLTPQFTEGMAGEFAAIAAAPTRWLISEFLMLLAFFLFMPAVLGLLTRLRSRALMLGYLGGSLMAMGSFFHGAIIGFALGEVPLVQRGGDHAQLVALTDAMYGHAAFTMLLVPFLGFFLGMILLAIALWRARIAPLWVAALLFVAVIAEFFGPEVVSPELMFVLLLFSFGWLGLRILRMSNTQWMGLDEGPGNTDVMATSIPQVR